ncbi:hypothetical protein DEHRE_13870 [Dehalobacter restrictus DSM 9455]|jgi:hypothetical protein|uniref:Exosortase n=1 Tax=Dehalobacter restrictus (strain DSM 9455 / PER-K23) TaxID=871738 RepID=A0ABN4BX00_DEHRP|nr:hypothetical protein DEHRE_13870 [Dehalobacter restrictus DSM 9455]
MALGIILIVASLTGLIYGIINKKKPLIVSSVIALIIIAIIWIVYSYLYSINPY